MIFKKTFHDETESTKDGRNVLPEQGGLEGEGAQQKVKQPQVAFPVPQQASMVPAVDAGGDGAQPSYYGKPVVKAPVWIWSIPTYFYVGGVTGAAGVLAAAAQLSGDASLRPFVRRLRWVNALGSVVSSGLLIHDLGRPSRFFNMLRVFRPTSPMNMGSWLLAGVGATSTVAALLSKKDGALGQVGNAAAMAAAVVDLPFTGYTAVLVTNSAVPVWQGARKSLPPLFIASSVASAGALVQLTESHPRALEIGRRFAIAGKAAELVLSEVMMKELALPEVKRPMQEGTSGKLWKASKVLGAAGLALSLLPSRWRWAQRAAGVLGTASVLATKFAVFYAGRPSAKDPQATFKMQREGRGAQAVGRGSQLVQLKVEGRPLPAGT